MSQATGKAGTSTARWLTSSMGNIVGGGGWLKVMLAGERYQWKNGDRRV